MPKPYDSISAPDKGWILAGYYRGNAKCFSLVDFNRNFLFAIDFPSSEHVFPDLDSLVSFLATNPKDVFVRVCATAPFNDGTIALFDVSAEELLLIETGLQSKGRGDIRFLVDGK